MGNRQRETRSLNLAVAVLGVAVSTCAAGMPGAGVQVGPSEDALVFVGAGRLSGWETRFTLSNPGSTELGVWTGVDIEIPGGCPITGCGGFMFLLLDPDASESIATPGTGELQAIYVRGSEGNALPIVTATTQNAANRQQVATLPGFRLSSLLNQNSDTLAFTGAMAGSGRTNLILTNLLTFAPAPIRGGEIVVRVDAYSQAGQPIGSISQEIAVGQSVLLPNVYEYLGGSAEEVGEIKVTRIEGTRAFWGVLCTIDQNGGVTASPPNRP